MVSGYIIRHVNEPIGLSADFSVDVSLLLFNSDPQYVKFVFKSRRIPVERQSNATLMYAHLR